MPSPAHVEHSPYPVLRSPGSSLFAVHESTLLPRTLKMAAKKTVVVQLGEFNRVIQFEVSTGKTERDVLLAAVRAAYSDRIGPEHRLTFQVKDEGWGGLFVDFFGDEVTDRSVMKVILERAEVCGDSIGGCMPACTHTHTSVHSCTH